MRLLVLSTVLPLVLGVGACVAPDEESPEWGAASAEAAEEPGTASPEITEKAAGIVNRIDDLLKLNRDWNERLRAGETTPEAKREIEQIVQKMRDTIAVLPADAEWVTGYAQEHRDEIRIGFAKELATPEMRAALGAAELQKLIGAVTRAGGIDEIIVKAAAIVRERSQEISDMLGEGKKMPLGYFCGLAGMSAGANAARQEWRSVVVPAYVLQRAGCIR